MHADLRQLRAALASALVALDFDGTLAPISPHPADARPLPGIHQILRDLRATGATLAVVTGRSVASLLSVSSFDAVPGIIVYGTHGAERWQDGDLPAIAEVQAWAERTGRPAFTVAVSPREPNPIAGQTDITVPDPRSLLPILRQISQDGA